MKDGGEGQQAALSRSTALLALLKTEVHSNRAGRLATGSSNHLQPDAVRVAWAGLPEPAIVSHSLTHAKNATALTSLSLLALAQAYSCQLHTLMAAKSALVCHAQPIMATNNQMFKSS